MTPNPVGITDTTFRDGHQSLLATRLRMEDMEPIAAAMDKIGFHSMEVWGGATFDVATRFLSEDPWERLRRFRELIPSTRLSMLLRGQSLVGYRAYADDVVEAFVERAAENGIDVFRVFDALNDEWNLKQAAESIKKSGKHLQMTICYSVTESGRMGGPIYSLEYFVSKAKEFVSMGADSLCIKDMAGLLAPYDAFNLVSALKQEVTIPLQLHTHYTSGMASMTVLKAIEAGVDIIDTALAPFALRTSQPAIEPIAVSLKGEPRDPDIDISALIELGDYLESIIPKYKHLVENTRYSVIDAKVLSHQIPGGMTSNLITQLREFDALDKLQDVLEDIPRTRKDLGYPPLVTPMSQMVGSQAVSNVLFGQYKLISDQVKDYAHGMYGRPPTTIDPNLLKKALKEYEAGNKQITERPANLLSPELEKAKMEISDISEDIDDVLIYALYPTTGLAFLRIKYGLDPLPVDVEHDSSGSTDAVKLADDSSPKAKDVPLKSQNAKAFNIFVDETFFRVEVDPINDDILSINEMKPPGANINEEKKSRQPDSGTSAKTLSAPMPGILLRYLVEEGSTVSTGDPIAVLEAMKMENTLPSPCDGIVESLPSDPGSTVVKGDILAIIS